MDELKRLYEHTEHAMMTLPDLDDKSWRKKTGLYLKGLNPSFILHKIDDSQFPSFKEVKEKCLNADENISVFIEEGLTPIELNIFQNAMEDINGIEAQVEAACAEIGSYADFMTKKFCDFHGIDYDKQIFNFFFDLYHSSGLEPLKSGIVYDEDFDYENIPEFMRKSPLIMGFISEVKIKASLSQSEPLLALLQASLRHHFNDKVIHMDLLTRKLRLLAGTSTSFVRISEPKTIDKESILSNMLQAVGINPALAPAFIDESPESRYYGVINYKIRSDSNRFFVLDTKTGEIEVSLCSHPEKSADYGDQGVCNVFSWRLGYAHPGLYKYKAGVLSDGKISKILYATHSISEGIAKSMGQLPMTVTKDIAIEPGKLESLSKKLDGSVIYIHG